jgi:hypothetical protein
LPQRLDGRGIALLGDHSKQTGKDLSTDDFRKAASIPGGPLWRST